MLSHTLVLPKLGAFALDGQTAPEGEAAAIAGGEADFDATFQAGVEAAVVALDDTEVVKEDAENGRAPDQLADQEGDDDTSVITGDHSQERAAASKSDTLEPTLLRPANAPLASPDEAQLTAAADSEENATQRPALPPAQAAETGLENRTLRNEPAPMLHTVREAAFQIRAAPATRAEAASEMLVKAATLPVERPTTVQAAPAISLPHESIALAPQTALASSVAAPLAPAPIGKATAASLPEPADETPQLSVPKLANSTPTQSAETQVLLGQPEPSQTDRPYMTQALFAHAPTQAAMQGSERVELEQAKPAPNMASTATAPTSQQAYTASEQVGRNLAQTGAIAEQQVAQRMVLEQAVVPVESGASARLEPTSQAPALPQTGQAASSQAPIMAGVREAMEAISRSTQNQIEIQLHPKELGKLRFTMAPMDGQMVVQISAERPDVLDGLRRNIELLSDELRAFGFEDAKFEFQQHTEGGERQGHNSPEYAEFGEQGENHVTPAQVQRWQLPSARLDIRV